MIRVLTVAAASLCLACATYSGTAHPQLVRAAQYVDASQLPELERRGCKPIGEVRRQNETYRATTAAKAGGTHIVRVPPSGAWTLQDGKLIKTGDQDSGREVVLRCENM